MLISQELFTKLQEKYCTEIENHNIYRYFANWCDVEGLTNLASYFENQADDELKHSQLVKKHLSDLGVKLTKIEIPVVDFNITDYKTLGALFFEREKLTTEKIQECLDIAYSDNDGISQKFLLDFIFEQREELNSADTLNRKIQNVSDIYLFDNTFEIG
jgi:ferritin